MVALDASIVVAGKDGERLVRAQEFFKGLFEVDLAPGELVVAVELPAQLKDQRSVFLELARRHGDYAIIGLAGVQGKVDALRILRRRRHAGSCSPCFSFGRPSGGKKAS